MSWEPASSVFKDEARLLPDYIPTTTPHREAQLRELTLLFRPVVQDPDRASQQALIVGPVGTGKTLLAKKLGALLEPMALAHGKRIKFFHTNCRIERGLSTVLIKALSSLGRSFPTRGFSFSELLQFFFDALEEEGAHLIVAFDEVEALLAKEGVSALYTIARLREISGRQAFSPLLISKTLDYLSGADASTLSSLQKNLILLEPYSEQQLYSILDARAQEAFIDGRIEAEAIRLASRMAAEYGDARYALDLLYRAGKTADLEAEQKVLPEHVRLARAQVPPHFRKDELDHLDVHDKLILLAVVNALKRSREASVSTGETEEAYRFLCEGRGLKPLHHTRLWLKLDGLSRTGLVKTQFSGRGRRGRTTLISIHIPAKSLETDLRRSLLEAKARG